MLVLSRGKDESIAIDGNKITITVVAIRGKRVRLGITAPPKVSVLRQEVYDAMMRNDGAIRSLADSATLPEGFDPIHLGQ